MHIPQTEVTLRHGEVELARVVLPPGEYVIGRSPEVEIPVETPLLSRQHARLTINYDHLLLEDLGSSNGTFVADRPITASTRLFPNQSIRLGPDIVLEVHRERAPSQPGVSLAPVQDAVRRALPEEVLTHKRYAIGQQVARGGMGAILAAQQQALQRPVAMKVMLDSVDPGDALRFVEEAQVTGQLAHPNIVPVYELGVDEQDQLFYTMKMVRGITLKKVIELLAQGMEATVKKYPLPALLTIFQKACDALAFAHSRGVIHRDLKPENIMLGDFGEVLVMDWGLAKNLGGRRSVGAPSSPRKVGADEAAPSSVDDAAASRTMAGSIMGTPAYMSPEQARGEVEILDARSDIYALGAILFELLHLRPVVTGPSAMAVVDKVARGTVEWAGLSRKDRPVPDSLLAVCRKALALEPAARYPGVEDLQRDLVAYQSGFATSAEHAGAWKQIVLLVKRHKATSIGMAAVLLVGVTLGTKAVFEGRRAEREVVRANLALADLREAAPTLVVDARKLIDEQKFDEAIAKIRFAIKIDPSNPAYHLLLGQMLQAQLKLREAAAEFRRVLARQPDPSAKANLLLCERLLPLTRADGTLDPAALPDLYQQMKNEGRLTQVVPIARSLGKARAAAEAILQARIQVWKQLPGWSLGNLGNRVIWLPDETLELTLERMPVDDLSALEGLPITRLSISGTEVSDLSPLQGMHLKSIRIANVRRLTDLSPLKGLPLESFTTNHETPVADFSPLQGSPIKSLTVDAPTLASLDGFRGVPVENLEILYPARALIDISAVRTMPLKRAALERANRVQDFSPLLECTGLEEVTLPKGNRGIEVLRQHPGIQKIKLFGGEFRPPAEFWAEYDAQQAAEKK